MNPLSTDGDNTADLLRQALADEAADVQPAPQALQSIQRRTSPAGLPDSGLRRPLGTGATRLPLNSRPSWILGALGAGVATAAVITAVVVIGDTSGGSSGSPAAAGETSRLCRSAAANVVLPATYVGLSGRGRDSRLYALRPLATDVSDRPISQLNHFLRCASPDRDYTSGWPRGLEVSGMESGDGSTQIDLKGPVGTRFEPDARLGVDGGELAVQALLRTAGLQPGERATVTFNGNPVSVILGVHLPVVVAADEDIRAPVSVEQPAQGQTVSSPVTVTGSANVFEANVNWDLLDADGRTVDEGFTSAGFMEWKPFTIDLGELQPGTYTIRAYEASPKNGRPTFIDDKTFTVS